MIGAAGSGRQQRPGGRRLWPFPCRTAFDKEDRARHEVEQFEQCRPHRLGGHLSEDFDGIRQGTGGEP